MTLSAEYLLDSHRNKSGTTTSITKTSAYFSGLTKIEWVNASDTSQIYNSVGDGTTELANATYSYTQTTTNVLIRFYDCTTINTVSNSGSGEVGSFVFSWDIYSLVADLGNALNYANYTFTALVAMRSAGKVIFHNNSYFKAEFFLNGAITSDTANAVTEIVYGLSNGEKVSLIRALSIKAGIQVSNFEDFIDDMIPSTVTSINAHAFSNANIVGNVVIPSTVTSLGDNAFFKTRISSLTINATITSIPAHLCYYCELLTTVVYPQGITSIGDSAFHGCTNLIPTIPSTVTAIYGSAFNGCVLLTILEFSNALTTIDSGAFLGCTGLLKLKFGSGITSIGNNAFKDCSSLEKIECYKEIPPTLGNNAFDNTNDCPIYVGNEDYLSASGWTNYTYRIFVGDPSQHNVLDYNGLSYYDEKIKEYIAEQTPNINLENGQGEKSLKQTQSGIATYESELWDGVPYFNIALLNDYMGEDYPVTDNQFTVDNITYTINAGATEVSGNGHTYAIAQRSFKIPINNKNTQCWLKYSGSTISYISLGEIPNAYGKYTTMLNGRSLAIGEYATADGQSSVAYGIRSVAINTKNVSYGQNTFAQGGLCVAEGQEASSMGYHNYAKGKYSHALGSYTKAVGEGSKTDGYKSVARGKFSKASGVESETGEDANSAYAMGRYTKANGVGSFSANLSTEANGDGSTAFGSNTKAEGTAGFVHGANTTAKKLTETIPSAPIPPTLEVGKRYRFHGTMPTDQLYEIQFSGIESIIEMQGSHQYVETVGNAFGGTGVSSYLQIANDRINGFSGAFNFYYASSSGDLSAVMWQIDEAPIFTLTKGRWYHFEGTLPNNANPFVFSKICNIQTTSTETQAQTTDWRFVSGHLQVGLKYYATFTGSFEFMFDGNTDINISGNYSEYYNLISNSILYTVSHNEHAEGAGTEAYGHGAHSDGVLTKAYGEGASSNGYKTTSGNLATWICYIKDYDISADTYKNISAPTTKYTHAGGIGTKATADGQTVFGKYNATDNDALFIVGNGTNDDNKQNAFEIMADGTLKIPNFDGNGNYLGMKTLKCVNGVLTVI